jgi:hypothetical protein
MVTGYKLDGGGVGTRFTIGARFVFLHSTKTESRNHQAFYQMHTDSSFPEIKVTGALN